MTKSRVFSAIGMVAAVGASTAVLVAQTPDKPTFEVTSIKPAAPARGEALGTQIEFQPGGRFVARHTSLFSLLIYAYRGDQFTLRADQVAGGPSWLTSAFFDIDAKVAGDPSPAPISMVPTGAALLRSLLEERFKLNAHMESRTSSVYVLLLARSDGTLGPTLRPSLVDCEALLEAARGNPPQPMPPPPAGRPQCGSLMGFGTLVTGGATMSKLVAALSSGTAVGSTVLDRTGLSGSYDIELQWRPERAVSPASAPDGPSIFTAVQEQLGLRLDRRRDSMDVLVIDHVELPTPN